MDWHGLQKKKVTELREMAKDKYKMAGVTAMNKAALVEALAHEMGIDKPHKVSKGPDKTKIKQAIKALKIKRDEALANHDRETSHQTRHEIHKLRRQLRKMGRLTH